MSRTVRLWNGHVLNLALGRTIGDIPVVAFVAIHLVHLLSIAD